MKTDEMPSGSALLHNVGAPMSRVRSEIIRSTFTGRRGEQGQELKPQRLWFIPHTAIIGQDSVVWLHELAVSLGYQDFQDALRRVPCPPQAMIAVVHQKPGLRGEHASAEETLQHAAVLTRVGNRFYDPAKPPVASDRRLHRIIELVELTNETFYELD